ncbi:hypothetical protein PtA15_7A228 [Puccinia triticina]|uniref:AMP-dependent synthetase/ligase domain-containing protein n=1 Tax=Puccinia triticina TaxID=208348 RepID=A0ABY7CUV7_9BASI|nr:uncharacterized protein PtA15_7A228 [Puccinia triticina]WAQ86502.1 hypothetical protein PtA15_7A228 [Puccinia triticina]
MALPAGQQPDNSSHSKLIGPEDDGVPTLWDSFLKGYSLAGGSSNCIGTRLTWDHSSPQPAQPQPEYQWLSYAQVLARIRDLSAGLIELFGPSYLPPAYRTSITVVSINDQLPAQAASKIINDTRPRAVILSTHNFHRLAGYRDHQRRYQITSSRVESCDLDSDHVDSPRSGIRSPPARGAKKTAPHEAAGTSAFESGSSSSRNRHSARVSQGPPSVSSSSARHGMRPSEPIYIITDPLQLSSHTRLVALQLGWSFYSLEEVARIGHTQIRASLPIDALDQTLEVEKVIETENLNPLRPGPRTLAGIVYSSGTTGDPKPCVLSHANFAANLAAFNYLVQQERLRDLHIQDLVQFSYLPLHHIYEKQTQAWVLNQGGSIGFSSLESPRFLSDLSVLRPTFLATTPSFLTHQILDRRLQFLNNFSSFKNPVESYLLNKAIEHKLKMLKAGFGEQIWLWDRFVLGYLRDQLGGRLKWIVSGTSPLSKDVAELLSASLSVKISEGYGLTETCGAACITVEDGSHHFQVGHVGPPLPCCEIKLEKVDGLKPTQGFQEGRVYVRGANVFQGYLIPGTSTSEERILSAVDSEGWFATGDIGYLDDEGRLHLIDRLLMEEGVGGGVMVLGQQIHHQFNVVDLCKIERRLAGAVQEVAQIFVSGRTAETHAEVGIGLLGDLVGFVVVDRPSFLRWIADSHPPQNQLATRHPDHDLRDHSHSFDGNRGDEWEIVDDLHEPPALAQDSHKAPLPHQSSADPPHDSDPECQVELDKICKDPQVIKSFLNYLMRRGKSNGLKSYELPKTIYLSPNEFKPTPYCHRDHPSNEKGKSVLVQDPDQHPPQSVLVDDDGPHQFISLNSKNSQLMAHFST